MLTYLLDQNTTLEISNKFHPIVYLFHGPAISHAGGFLHWSILFHMHVDLQLANSSLSIHFTFLPPSSFYRFRADARAARVFQ
jgi:hypothetical protein